MIENELVGLEKQQPEVKQPVKLGAVERVTMTIPQDIPIENTNNSIENKEGANAILDAKSVYHLFKPIKKWC